MLTNLEHASQWTAGDARHRVDFVKAQVHR
ncbi:hypothetical protein BTL_4146 [Burkholderia thailandensis H0587]|nr:hypothetical protein BTL_4146 [Burkholderia thailandensis H0587]